MPQSRRKLLLLNAQPVDGEVVCAGRNRLRLHGAADVCVCTCTLTRGIMRRNRAFFEQCGFRAMQTVDVCSEDSPVVKIYHMTRVPFPKSIELV